MGENGSLSDEETLVMINDRCDGGYTVVVPYRGRKFLAVTSHGPGPTWGLWTKSDGDLPGVKPEVIEALLIGWMMMWLGISSIRVQDDKLARGSRCPRMFLQGVFIQDLEELSP